jgi:ketosteroid isomerase-like protein
MTEAVGGQVVNALFRALARGDLAGAQEFMHEGLVVHEPPGLPYTGDWSGRDGFATLLRRLNSLFSVDLRAFHLVEAADRVVLCADAVFTCRATGRALPMPIVEVYRLEDGKIIDIDVFYKDPAAVAALEGCAS